MKKITILFLFVLAGALYSCSGDQETAENRETENPENTASAKPDWTDLRKIGYIVSKDFTSKSFEKGMMHAALTNPADKSLVYYKASSPDSLHQTTENTAFLGVKILTDKEVPGMLDYKVSWDPSFSQQDSTFGRFKVTGISFRVLGDKTYYDWEKNGDFWEKVYPQAQ